MMTKASALEAARLVHGPAAEVRAKRSHAAGEYVAEVFARRSVKGPRAARHARRVVIESARARSAAGAYDALFQQLYGRAYAEPVELVADHGEAGKVYVSTTRPAIPIRDVPRDATVLRAFAMEVEGDSATIAAALELVTKLGAVLR